MSEKDKYYELVGKRVKILTGKDKGKFGEVHKEISALKVRVLTDDGFRIVLNKSELDFIDGNDKKWGTIREAVAYYDVATHTIHSWRRTGKIESKEAPYGKRMGYKYLLDPELKEIIDAVKIYDKRWG